VEGPPDDREPYVDDWFEEDDQTQVRQQQPPLRRRPGLPPSGDRRIPGIALVGGAALLLLVVILVVALTGNGEPATDPGQEVPTVGDATEPEEPPTEEPPPAGEPPQPLPTESIIRPGEEGEQVAALQQALITLGYEPGEPDGNYGPATVEAVRSFQTAAGLPADGIAGPTTLSALNEALAAQG
jgi:hypothetical protein